VRARGPERRFSNRLCEVNAVRMIAIATLMLCAASRVILPIAHAEAAAGSPVLVELFTSEGCSSCPPADTFLRQLDASQPIAGAQLIVLSEHVDYWDHQGWPDPFASASLTSRQSAYVRALRLREAYTPQFIVDGAADMRLSNRQQIEQILLKAAAAPKIPVSITSVTFDANTPASLSGTIEVNGDAERTQSDLYVGVALDHVESNVLRGENRGRSLTHVAVVEELIELGTLTPGQKSTREFRVTLKAGVQPHDVRIVAFVQESGHGKIVGAALRRTALDPG
jgi:hypothetical protein